MQKSSILKKKHEQSFGRRQLLNTNHNVRRSLQYKKEPISTSSDESLESLLSLEKELESPLHRPVKKFIQSANNDKRKHDIFKVLQLTASKRKRAPNRFDQNGIPHPARIQAENFVMKLFDRSLDLSKYSEHNPLYPICRAWMANQPRNPSVRNYNEKSEFKILPRAHNGEETLRKLQSGELKEVIIWPLPKPAPPGLMRFPKGGVIKNPEDVNADKWANATQSEMLAMHKKHWKSIKSNWIKQNRIYDHHRYGIIYKILDHLHKNN